MLLEQGKIFMLGLTATGVFMQELEEHCAQFQNEMDSVKMMMKVEHKHNPQILKEGFRDDDYDGDDDECDTQTPYCFRMSWIQ
jgi:hypothetical protein